MTVSPLVSVQDGCKRLPDGSLLLHGINLDVAVGESVAIIGRSGSGKSTLLSILGHLDRFDEGVYSFEGISSEKLRPTDFDRTRANKIGFVFQRFALVPHLTVLENVLVPLRHAGRLRPGDMRLRGNESLASVGMSSLVRRFPRHLSGGEQQRVAIARALVHHPRLILADEPTGSLDQQTGAHVMSLLVERVRQQQAGLIVVTHDLEVASRMDRVLRVVDETLKHDNSASGAL